MKYKKTADILTAVCFVGFLCALFGATVLRRGAYVSYYENRALTGLPALTREGLLDGGYFSSWESWLTDHAAGRNTLLKLNAWAEIHLFRRPVVNGIVLRDDILLEFQEYYGVSEEYSRWQAEREAERLARLDALVQGYGGSFYYVAVPGQSAYFMDRYPWYLDDYDELTAVHLRCFTEALADRGVELLDMGPVFAAKGNPAEYFSAVDYHFTAYGAYETYVSLMERVEARQGLGLAVLRPEDAEFTELPNHYLGSRLRKIFDLWPIDERAAVIEPRTPVPFTRTDGGAEVPPEVYSLPEGAEMPVTYDLYMGGDKAETVIDTHRPELPSVLIYGDSFTNAVEALAWYGFDKLYSIDLRHYGEKTLAEYIGETRPDIVICLRDYQALLSAEGNGDPFGEG